MLKPYSMPMPAQIQTAAVQIPNGDLLIDAYLAQPTESMPKAAILVIQEIFYLMVFAK